MSDPQEGTKVVTFGRQELDPDEATRYKDQIAKAKSGLKLSQVKGSTPLGHVERLKNIPLMSRQAAEAAASPTSDTGGVQPRPPGSPAVRPETVQQLQDMQKAQEKQAEAAPTTEEGLKKDIEKDKEDLFELFDFSGKTEADRILNNKKRKKEIEARLEPMKLEDLIMRDEVQQEVPIIPEKFVVKYRSATPQESLFVKRLMADEKIDSDQYIMEKYGIYQLTLALVSINGIDLPSHLDADGVPKDELFTKKLKMIMKKSGYIIADLGVNFFWFDLRVRRLLNPDDLKNG